VGLANLGSESETCVGSRVRLVGVSISFEKNFYRLPFTPPLFGSPFGPSFPSKIMADNTIIALGVKNMDDVWLIIVFLPI
jgi:hypothetical protein